VPASNQKDSEGVAPASSAAREQAESRMAYELGFSVRATKIVGVGHVPEFSDKGEHDTEADSRHLALWDELIDSELRASAERQRVAEHCCSDAAFDRDALLEFMQALGLVKHQIGPNEWEWKNDRADAAEAKLQDVIKQRDQLLRQLNFDPQRPKIPLPEVGRNQSTQTKGENQ